MYKGNMGDFVSKLSSYLQRNEKGKLLFGLIDRDGNGDMKYYVAYFAPKQMGASGYTVYDTDDFEQQIYDYVNKELEDVQGEYDGFPEPPDDLFGDEIPEFDD